MVSLDDFEFRTVDLANSGEFRAFLRLFWDIPGSLDPQFERPSDQFVEEWMESARARELDENTYSGVALRQGSIVGLHIVRRFEEGGRIGAHAAGLWVDPSHRGLGVARRLKQDGEAWASRVAVLGQTDFKELSDDEQLQFAMWILGWFRVPR